jgi:hypothetical protein
MRLDTECDVVFATTLTANAACGPTIRAFRDGLLAEHFAMDAQEITARISRSQSVIAVIEELRAATPTLRPYETPDLSSVEEWLGGHDVLGAGDDEESFEPLSRRKLLGRRHSQFPK